MLLTFLLSANVDRTAQASRTGNGARASDLVSGRESPIPAAKLQAGISTTIKIDVALVTVPAMVTDRNGVSVPGLIESDFRIYENNVAQTIARLIPEGEPFNIVLMIDRSGSTHFKSGEMQDAALEFINSLRPHDRMLVVSFDHQLHFDSDFTEDRSLLRQAVLQARESGGMTRLYDAVGRVAGERLSRLSGRKAIVLFTDGVDNGSARAGSADTLAMVEQSDVIVYAIQYDTRKDGIPDRFQVPPPSGYPGFNALYSRGVRYLRDLTGHSGGRLYQAQTLDKLTAAFAQIADELQRQYTLCYYPANQKRDGSLRRIRVTVSKLGVKIRARTSYRAGKQ